MSILQSIKPVHCENITAGIKKYELRKTRPKCELPVKVHIYCTKAKKHFTHGGIVDSLDDLYRMPNSEIKYGYSGELMCCNEPYTADNFLNGKVIGEYVCDEIREIAFDYLHQPSFLNIKGYLISADELKRTCLTYEQLNKYGKGKKLYLWHISDLKIYDKPKELSEFFYACKQPKGTDCSVCRDNRGQTCKSITRPPQSWCYVEEV